MDGFPCGKPGTREPRLFVVSMAEKNEQLRHAWDFVENTGISIFLTGKAGTGKTTFLRTVCERSPKRMVVVAPTGVAAINAGGMTIHSFFQLPLSPYIPSATYKQHYNFSKEKRSIIRTLDLLVIDEISMVRSDLLDAIDDVMRRFRDPLKPFGGVQLLLIGDLQQLTPVVTADEEALLRNYYDTPYFFGSHALQKVPYVTIQLQHVYRQQDQEFIDILNHIRDGRPTATDLQKLNARCQPVSAALTTGHNYIRLTTHNRLADAYNEEQLLRIQEAPHRYEAHIDGVFPEYAYPTDVSLTLKRGAQVMFVKNDPSPEHRFYNGRIGIVTDIFGDKISVHCEGDEQAINVEPLTWENAKYELNADSKEIETTVQGTFQQLPLRLAWAITIHKSQGLTFEHAIIDASLSFAAGQVYVALSRCKSLQGLLLASPITAANVFGDQRVASYIAQEEEQARMSIESLPRLKEEYYREQLRQLFDFSELESKYNALLRQLDEHFYNTYPRLCGAHREARSEFAKTVKEVGRKWSAHIAQMQSQQLHEPAFLDRVSRSAVYFLNTLTDLLGTLLEKTNVETDNKMVRRRMTDVLADCRLSYNVKVGTLAAVAREGFTLTGYLHQKQMAVLDAMGTEPKKEKRDRKSSTRKSSSRKSSAPSSPAASASSGNSSTPSSSAVPPSSGKSSAPGFSVGSGTATAPSPSLTDITDPPLFEALRNWRWEKAKESNLPPYTILQQKALHAIVNSHPATLADLLSLPYIGKITVDKYGTEILAIVNKA